MDMGAARLRMPLQDAPMAGGETPVRDKRFCVCFRLGWCISDTPSPVGALKATAQNGVIEKAQPSVIAGSMSGSRNHLGSARGKCKEVLQMIQGTLRLILISIRNRLASNFLCI
jgi:hypothetical protein